MKRARLLFALLFGSMLLLVSCEEKATRTTTGTFRRDTTRATTLVKAPTWPPDTISISFAGPGIIMLSSQPSPGSPAGWSATYRLAPLEQTQGGVQSGTAVDRFRALVMEQPAGLGQGSVLFLKAPTATGK